LFGTSIKKGNHPQHKELVAIALKGMGLVGIGVDDLFCLLHGWPWIILT
jgi:hypothetical protein